VAAFSSSSIARFVRHLRGGYRRWNLGLVAASHALVLAAGLFVVDLLAPEWLLWAAGAALVWLALVVVWTAVHLRAPLEQADRELGLRDRLLTYLGLSGREDHGRSEAFARWLEEDLEGRLAAIPEADTAKLWRRPLGRLRYLLPLLVLLLLLRELAPLPLRPADEGPPMADSGGGGNQGPGEPPQGGDPSEPEPQQQPQPEQQPVPPPDPPPPEPPPEAQEQPPDPLDLVTPPPLEDVTEIDEFVVPQFIGEGETRKQMTKLALIEEGGAGGPPPPKPPRAEANQAPPDPRALDDYEKAHERALRARHVPPNERGFVKAYFDALLEAMR
jgi:hypothetical protein